jgi:ribosomal protein S18 acetylase RimI-like enzyme
MNEQPSSDPSRFVDVRAATKGDARDLATLIDMAGEHLPAYQWASMASAGQSPMEVGMQRASREEGSFSYRNARIFTIDGCTAGMVLGYVLPDPYDAGDLDSYPDVIRPLIELESLAAGSWYVNAIATYDRFRGRGVGTTLMAWCMDAAQIAGTPRLSLIVAGENEGAHRLYLKLGYIELASRPLVTYPGGPAGGDWVLMVKDL